MFKELNDLKKEGKIIGFTASTADFNHAGLMIMLEQLKNDFEGVLLILDTIETIYTQLDDYKNSWEMGVVYNNRASVYITQAIYIDEYMTEKKDSLLLIAENNILKSINFYENWLTDFSELSEANKELKILSCFSVNSRSFIVRRSALQSGQSSICAVTGVKTLVFIDGQASNGKKGFTLLHFTPLPMYWHWL